MIERDRIEVAAAARAQELGTKLGLLPGAWLGDLIPVLERLLLLEAAAQDVVNIHLNDAGPEAFATMSTLRDVLRTPHAPPQEKR